MTEEKMCEGNCGYTEENCPGFSSCVAVYRDFAAESQWEYENDR